jgi:multiple sugar transport system substrate-binding protein
VGWGGANAFHGQWLDLAPYIEASNFDTSVFEPALLPFYQTDEGQVGLPFIVYPAAVYYVPVMFDKAGLNYPPQKYGEKYKWPNGNEEEWSWDTLAKVARQLTIDGSGHSTLDNNFNRNNIVQYGYTPQWQVHITYQASYIAGAAPIIKGNAKNGYQSAIPASWKTANRWIYDGIWGPQPFIPSGLLDADPNFGTGNLFGAGKAAMTVTPIWYTCCLDGLKNAGLTFEAAVLPVGADGKPHGHVDAETLFIWKGTKHPEAAFKALSYLLGPEGIQTLLVGSSNVQAAYVSLPANSKLQQPYIDGLLARYPFTTAKTWNVFKAGLAYADIPSAEQYQPNRDEAWKREQAFFDLLRRTPPNQFDFDAEWQKMVDDLNKIYKK